MKGAIREQVSFLKFFLYIIFFLYVYFETIKKNTTVVPAFHTK